VLVAFVVLFLTEEDRLLIEHGLVHSENVARIKEELEKHEDIQGRKKE
jgi:hypothetical protein